MTVLRGAAVVVLLLLPISIASGSSSDPIGDQTTDLGLIFARQSLQPICRDPATDVVDLAVVTNASSASVRLTLSAGAATPDCAGAPLPQSARIYIIRGTTSLGDAEFYFDGELGYGIVWVGGNGLNAVFEKNNATLSWTFDLYKPALSWCSCPALDVRGQELTIQALATTYVPAGSFVITDPLGGWNIVPSPNIAIRDSTDQLRVTL